MASVCDRSFAIKRNNSYIHWQGKRQCENTQNRIESIYELQFM